MNRKFILGCLAALVVLGAGAQDPKKSRHSHSKSKPTLTSPISADATVARISADTMDKIFQVETALRDQLLKERFFAKPLADQKSSLSAIFSYLIIDPLHGLTPRFVIDSDRDFKAQDDFKAWQRYMVDGQVRIRLLALLQKSQGVLFDKPAKLIAQIEFYNKVGTQASAGLRVFDEMMYKLASGTPAFRKEQGMEGHVSWRDVLTYCNIDETTFLYYFNFDANTRQLVLNAYFENQLQAVKEHGDELPPAKSDQWATTAEKFLNEDVAKFRQTVLQAGERAGGNARILALQQKDLALVAALEKVLKGIGKTNANFNDGTKSPGQLRTGKGLYKYTKSRYSLPDPSKDKVPDHVFLLNLMLRRYQNDMQGLRVRTLGISDEQRRKAAVWRKQQMKAK